MDPIQPMLPAGTFRGRTIVITGGGTGLGRAMAECLLRLGGNVVICGRRAAVIEEAAAQMNEGGGELPAEGTTTKTTAPPAPAGTALAVPCDVRQPDDVSRLFDAAGERFGQVDALINNAAGNFICPTERLSPGGFQAVVDIVLRGTFHCTLAAGQRWIAAGRGGAVLNIVTTYAWTGSGYVVPSATAKAGVLAMTRSLASEWGKYGIRLNAIAPGPFPTEGAWSRLMPPEVQAGFDPTVRIPVGRFGRPEELANLAAYLLSDYAAYIQGECVTIDGGEWLRGAGEFNGLDAVTPDQWDALQARLRPGKKG